MLEFSGRIDISNLGKGLDLRLGDINGDGILELLVIGPTSTFDDRFFPHPVCFIAAYSITGEMLWQVGEPNTDTEFTDKFNLPCQIFDIDNDGNNEVLYISGDEFIVLDGMTGNLKKSYPLPSPDASDAIIIADLEGKGYPSNIILKNRFHQLWAMDSNFNIIWTYKGNIGLYPWPYDINDDGRDELIAGYTVLSGDGEVMFSVPNETGHAKYIWVGDLLQTGEMGKAIAVLGDRLTIMTLSGEVVYQEKYNANDIAFANICEGIHGTQIASSGETLSIYTSHLEKITELPIKAEHISALHSPDGSGFDMLILFSKNAPSVLVGKDLCGEQTFPSADSAVWADIHGDSVGDLVLMSGDKIEIYLSRAKETTDASVPYFRPQPKRLYNYTRFAGEMEAGQYALYYVTGCFSKDELEEWATNTALTADPAADNAITRADFAVLLVSTLGLSAYERDNFSDVSKKDYFYQAVGTLKKLGISEGVLGRFNPYAPMTAEAAVDMIKKAGRDCFTMSDGEITLRNAARIILELILH
ncbi:MAG: S-layer homology domain-containing protein [Clostridia bacterium]|nr:S-layer homology domain-containing protein [Clostridia bacterium]